MYYDAMNDSDMDLWHKKLNHFDIDLIKNTSKKTNINHECRCRICVQTKLKNHPFYPA